MIKGPKNAVPTLRGWVAPNGELLKCQKITQEQIDEWNGVAVTPAPAPQPEPVVVEAEPEVLVQEELEAAPEPPPVAVAAPKLKNSAPKTNKFAQAINRAKSKIGK